jgi:hypothetical protein
VPLSCAITLNLFHRLLKAHLACAEQGRRLTVRSRRPTLSNWSTGVMGVVSSRPNTPIPQHSSGPSDASQPGPFEQAVKTLSTLSIAAFYVWDWSRNTPGEVHDDGRRRTSVNGFGIASNNRERNAWQCKWQIAAAKASAASAASFAGIRKSEATIICTCSLVAWP